MLFKCILNKQKEDKQRQIKDALKDKNRLRQIGQEEDRSKMKKNMERLRKQRIELLKIQKRWNVKGIHDLKEYFIYLKDTNQNLEYQNTILQKEKEQKIQKLQKIKDELESLKLFTHKTGIFQIIVKKSFKKI